MANVVNKIFTDRIGGRKASEYIGKVGDLFYDSDVGDLRISDGRTAGGKPVGGGDTANGIYRGFQAGVNIIRQNNIDSGGEYDMAQIFIHDAEGRVDYINYTRDTNHDDFYVTGLIRDDINESNSFAASQVVAINVYSATNGGLTTGDLRTFARQFIDSVLYNDQDEKVTNPQTAKELFYANIEKLTQSLPAGSLYPNFFFDDGDRISYPEYNMVHADGSTDNANYSAQIRIIIDPDTSSGPYPFYDTYQECAQFQYMGGTGYSIGDKILVNGAQLGGTDGVNDMTLTVETLIDGNIVELAMTSGGTGFYPSGYVGQGHSLQGEVAGTGASIHINSCTADGAIVGWELREGGSNYQVGDILSLNFGGADALFEVLSVGTDGIDEFRVEGVAHLTSPYRAGYGYWPKYRIQDGLNDQYDNGNFISTDRGTSSFMANIDGSKLTIDYDLNSGINLQSGMLGTTRDPNNITNGYSFRLISQATDNANIWYIDNNINDGYYQVRFDGIDYNRGDVYNDGSFGNGEGSGDYVVVYDQSIFALMAFGLQDVNSVYYNGGSGADSNGTKSVEVLLGSADGVGDSKLIPQRLVYDGVYTLQTADIGKHIYNPAQNMTVEIPPDSVANFPVGSAITFVSGGGIIEFNRDNGDTTEVYGAGFNTTSPYWAIPMNSMATLLKVGTDKWIVSGAGLYNND